MGPEDSQTQSKYTQVQIDLIWSTWTDPNRERTATMCVRANRKHTWVHSGIRHIDTATWNLHRYNRALICPGLGSDVKYQAPNGKPLICNSVVSVTWKSTTSTKPTYLPYFPNQKSESIVYLSQWFCGLFQRLKWKSLMITLIAFWMQIQEAHNCVMSIYYVNCLSAKKVLEFGPLNLSQNVFLYSMWMYKKLRCGDEFIHHMSIPGSHSHNRP